jgi:hypothetical protein
MWKADRSLIAIHLGWIEKTSTGEVPWRGNIRSPSTFALTWLPPHNGVSPSNRWKRIKSDAEAKDSALPTRSLRKIGAFRLSSTDKKNRIPPPKALLRQVTIMILVQVATRYLARVNLPNPQVTTAVFLSISRLGARLGYRQILLILSIPTEAAQSKFPRRASLNGRMPST